jgi:hypothetical protein
MNGPMTMNSEWILTTKNHTRRHFVPALLLTLMALVLLLPVSVSAQDTELPTATDVTVRLTTDDAALTVGDPAELMLEVTHPAGYQVFVPEMAGTWGEFEIQSQSPKTTEVNADGSETTRQTFEAALFAPGTYLSPVLPITLSDTDGNLSQAIAEPVSLEIVSVLAVEDVEIRDIKPQASLEIPNLMPFVAGGALLFLVLAAIGGWLVYRKLSARTRLDNRTPDQVATDELARIGGLQLAQAGEFTEHYALVTTCLYIFIERQYQVPALEQTTSELRRTLRTTSMSEPLAKDYIALFEDSDLVKFADFSPSIDVATQLIDQAQTLVKQSAAEVAAEAANQNNNSQGTHPPSATPTPVQA